MRAKRAILVHGNVWLATTIMERKDFVMECADSFQEQVDVTFLWSSFSLSLFIKPLYNAISKRKRADYSSHSISINQPFTKYRHFPVQLYPFIQV
jgi:hypothetical protein